MPVLRMSLGVVLWALHFALVYGFTAIACARGFAAAVPWIVGAATALAAALAIALIVANISSEFTRWMTAALAAFALVAIVWEGIPAFIVPTCA